MYIYIHVYHISCVIWWIKIKNVNTPVLLFLTQSVVEVIILNLEEKTHLHQKNNIKCKVSTNKAYQMTYCLINGSILQCRKW